MKKVLIALDYDPTAQKVAEKGFLLAQALGAETTLLHVLSDPSYYAVPGHITVMGFGGYMDTNQYKIENNDDLKKASYHFLDKSKHHLGDYAIKTRIEEGDIAESIEKVAKDIHADIIVIGTHSRKWLENIIMGSVAEKVLKHTVIPLYIVPTKKKE